MGLPVCQYGDIELWQSFKKGSEEAFGCLYERYVTVLFSYGCKISSDEYLVKDCLQDLFFNLWRMRSNLADTDSVKYYLFRCLRREIIRKSNRESLPANYPVDFTSDARESPIEDALIADEDQSSRRRLLERALLQLSPRQQEAVHLRFYEDTSFEDIARIMNITPRAVYKLIYRAIGALQKTYISSMRIAPELLPLALLLSLIRFA
jgi:RNA polymerase sigma factor (sigma-70 family)